MQNCLLIYASPPKESCYMGGWIIHPQITKAGEIIPNVKPKNGLNKIEYNKFNVLMIGSFSFY